MSTTTAATAGPAFRVQREAAEVTLRSMARASGVSHSTISRWERGDREVSTSTALHLLLTFLELVDETAGTVPV